MFLRRHIALVTLLLSVQVGLMPMSALSEQTTAPLHVNKSGAGLGTAESAYNEAENFARAKNYVAAKDAYTRAIACNPPSDLAGEIYFGRGTVCCHLEDLDAALADFSAAQRYPLKRGAQVLEARAAVYMQKGDFAAGVRDVDAAIAINSKDANLFVERAFAQYKLGHIDEAIADSTKALTLNPAHGTAYVLRGRLYELNHAALAAQMDFDQAKKLNTPNIPLSEWK